MPDRSTDMWEFELYVNDNTRHSTIASENLSAFCDKHLEGHCHVQVFDLSKHPEMGFENNICVTPTLIKRNPSPIRMMVGDLSDAGSVAKYLEIPLAEQNRSRQNAYPEGLRKQGLSSRGRHLRGQH